MHKGTYMNKLAAGVLTGVVAVSAITGIAISIKSNNGNEGDHSATGTNQKAEVASSSNQVQSGEVNVDISNFDFQSPSIKIKPGTKVTWTNKDSARHDVMPEQESPDFKGSGKLLAKGESYSFTFDKPGKYAYFCTPHPYMKASVEVVE